MVNIELGQTLLMTTKFPIPQGKVTRASVLTILQREWKPKVEIDRLIQGEDYWIVEYHLHDHKMPERRVWIFQA